MKNIQVLSNGLINQIAAGEVVERPVSVVKELVENAVDAGAASIAVSIADGGISLVRVADNGSGIPKEQVKTAFLRHATSKIASYEDLESVLSLGFRGEALSSIASVAEVELTTKTADMEQGYKIALQSGVVESEGDAAATNGTSVTVRNLFYNTPARRKFLKKPQTESGYISDIMIKFAIGHPDIAFKYTNNATAMLQTNGGGDLKTAILFVYGKETAANIVPVAYQSGDIRLSGFAGKPVLNRGNRSHELVYLNGRYIKSELIQAASEAAYKTLLMQGKFPFYILRLTMDPKTVDVNVHPTKLEVRFADEKAVYSAVYNALTDALDGTSFIPDAQIGKQRAEAFKKPALPGCAPVSAAAQTEMARSASVAKAVYGQKDAALSMREAQVVEQTAMPGRSLKPWEKTAASAPPPKEALKPRPQPADYRVIGQVFSTYWLLERPGEMLLIDQHAAHERVIYDELMIKSAEGAVTAQLLLEPVVMKLSESERQVYTENRELFGRFGFELDIFGPDTFALRAVPYVTKSGAPSANFFIEMLDRLSSVSTSVSDLDVVKANIVATTACKAAVKAGDSLSYAEAKALIDRVMALHNPYTCPHGRPTIVRLSKYEIEKMFKRV